VSLSLSVRERERERERGLSSRPSSFLSSWMDMIHDSDSEYVGRTFARARWLKSRSVDRLRRERRGARRSDGDDADR